MLGAYFGLGAALAAAFAALAIALTQPVYHPPRPSGGEKARAVAASFLTDLGAGRYSAACELLDPHALATAGDGTIAGCARGFALAIASVGQPFSGSLGQTHVIGDYAVVGDQLFGQPGAIVLRYGAAGWQVDGLR